MGAGKSGESPALSRSGNRGRKPLGAAILNPVVARQATGALRRWEGAASRMNREPEDRPIRPRRSFASRAGRRSEKVKALPANALT